LISTEVIEAHGQRRQPRVARSVENRLHGNDAGYRALADSIDMSLFERGTGRRTLVRQPGDLAGGAAEQRPRTAGRGPRW
jgi:hypothetical protein